MPLTPALLAQCETILYSMSRESLRVLAFASKDNLGDLADYDGPSHPSHRYSFCFLMLFDSKLLDFINYETIESGLTFYGFVGIKV